MALSTFLYFFAIGVALPVIPRLVTRELGGGGIAVGAAAIAYSAAAIVVRPGLTFVAQRRGLRTLMLWGLALGVLAFALTAPASALWVVLATRLLGGVAEAGQFVGAATIVAERTPADRRAEAASYFSVFLFAGVGTGPLVGDLLSQRGRYAEAFLLCAAVTAVAAAVAAVTPRTPPHPVDATAVAPPSDGGSPQGAAPPLPPAPTRRLVHPAAVAPGIVLALPLVGYTGFNTFGALRADEVGLAQAGLPFLVNAGLTLCIRLFGAKLPERVGLVRTVAAALVAMAAGLVVMGLWRQPVGLMTGTVVMAFGIALLYPSLQTIAINGVGDDERAAVMSTFTAFFEVGALAGGALLGPVAAVTDYGGALAVGGVVALAGLPVLVTMRRRPAAT